MIEGRNRLRCIFCFSKAKHHGRTNTIKHCLLTKHFTVWTPCLVLFDRVFNRVWSCLMKFEGHQSTFDQKLKLFLLFSCFMGDVSFVWTAPYQTCLMQACVPLLLIGLHQLFDLCLIGLLWDLESP